MDELEQVQAQAAELERELRRLRRLEQDIVFAARRCRICGEPDEENGGMKGFLTSMNIRISEGEEGHSVIEGWLCDEDLPMVTEALAECGLVIHAHGGICFLEDQTCPGAQSRAACPTPEAQYED